MTAHTPGPWTAYSAPTPDNSTRVCIGGKSAVCALLPTGRRYVDEANAAMIAAAPDVTRDAIALLNWAREQEHNPDSRALLVALVESVTKAGAIIDQGGNYTL